MLLEYISQLNHDFSQNTERISNILTLLKIANHFGKLILQAELQFLNWVC